ncbi:ABC transporter ATP-binding protein [bacterium]|nr:MAG: ABC transporter ATP-binding protein [bacterium]
MKAAKPKDAVTTLKRLWGYLSPQKAALLATGITVTASSGLTLLGPYLLGRAIDGYITKSDLPGLKQVLLLMLVVYLMTSLLTWVQSVIMVGVAANAVRNLRRDLFEKLAHMPLRFFDTRPHGDVMSRLTNDVENVNQTLSDTLTTLISGLLTLVGAAILMVLLSIPLTVIAVGTIVLLSVGLNRWIVSHTREAFRSQQTNLGSLNSLIEETVGGQRTVVAFRRQQTVLTRFDEANSELRTASTRAQTYSGFTGPLMNGTGNLSLALVVGAGGVLALRGFATVGTIAAFLSYTRQFARPLNDIANLFNSIQGAIAGAERVFEVLDEEVEVDAEGAKPLGTIRGEVVFDHVDFSYVAGTPVLRDVSLRALPGQTIALVGPTGAGKTTIINLLTRFYEIDSGTISIDGEDIRGIAKNDLRRQLGIVLQDTFLFSGTVRDNIAYGRLDAPLEDVKRAATLANADVFIRRLPQGYDTVLSERAGNLSQGQRQLLAIARAILADPRILILDEATSSVDTRTEIQIQEAMRRLMAGRTSFVIAHRLSTIREADQILVLSGGQIIERGTDLELMSQGGFYARMKSRSEG